jgi:hypothetical protein
MKRMKFLILGLVTIVFASCANVGTLVIDNIPDELHGKSAVIVMEGYGDATMPLKSRIERSLGFFKSDQRYYGMEFGFIVEIEGFKYTVNGVKFENEVAIVNWDRFKLQGATFEGAWWAGNRTYTFRDVGRSSGKFEYGTDATSSSISGTFTYDDTHITFNTTHIRHWGGLREDSSEEPFTANNSSMFPEHFTNNTPVPYNFSAGGNYIKPSFRLNINGVVLSERGF